MPFYDSIDNIMPGLTHREPGVVGAVFDDSRVTGEMICDGLHIDPAVLRITFEMLGKDRVVVVSDSMRAAGQPNGAYDLGGQTVYVQNGAARLKDGTLAGSTTNLHQEVKNLVGYGVPFLQAIQAATLNPAREIHGNGGAARKARGDEKNGAAAQPDRRFFHHALPGQGNGDKNADQL